MSLTGKIINLFTDKENTNPIFPRTKVKAVSDDNGVGLDATLASINNSINTLVTHTHSNATTSKAGFMSASDKTTLNNLVSAVDEITPGKTLQQHLSAEKMVLSSLQYGDTLPSAGTKGRIFFKRLVE